MFSSIKNIFISVSLIVIMLGGMGWLFKLWQTEKSERQRFENNWYAMNDTVKTWKTKSGWLAQELRTQEVRAGELEIVNKGLADDVKELKIKLKDAQSITKIETIIKYVNKDSIVYVEIEPGRKKFDIIEPDGWFNASVIVTDCEHIKPGDFNLETRDSTIVVPDIKYRGWWFWKRVSRVSVTVANKNPYAKNNITHYNIIK